MSLSSLPPIAVPSIKPKLHQSTSSFCYGGILPLYATFESERAGSESNDSSDDELEILIDAQQNEEEKKEKEQKETKRSKPSRPKRVRFAANTPTKSTKAVSFMRNGRKIKREASHRKNFTMSMIESPVSPRASNRKNEKRTRAQTAKISTESFQHFRIKRISIAAFNHYQPPISDDDNKENIEQPDGLNDTETKAQKISNKTAKKGNIPAQSKRTLIEKEIIETEQTYLNGLNILLHELINPMFEQILIDSKHQQQITSNIPQLLAFHDKFLSELVAVHEYEQIIDDDPFKSISQVFISQNKEELISLYFEYVSNYDAILDLFGNMVQNKELQKFLKQKRRERKPLTNYLILPIQRIPRYILLLNDLNKHTKQNDIDHKHTKYALECVQEIANEINERKRIIENRSTLLQIQESLNGLTESIIQPNREFLKQFVFIKKANNRQRILFCFNDIVIVTNSKLKVKHILDVRTIEIKFQHHKEVNSDEEVKFAEFNLLHPLSKKPILYISKTIADIEEFEKIIKENRLILMDIDLAKESDTFEIRRKLKEQGVTQANDYQMEVKTMKSNRKRGNASVDKDVLSQSTFALYFRTARF